jgi:hypothetical protein
MAFLLNLGIEGIDKLRFMATLHLIKPEGKHELRKHIPQSPVGSARMAGMTDHMYHNRSCKSVTDPYKVSACVIWLETARYYGF